ncbi:MAG: PstS family phosphate ABC transporter substrate-binding protein [Cyanobacteria bacterium REEB459]|nr:PstS family phosphate ABC transporter substrate-binding protein [Cyanobacteria bacterium REEB459]
MKLSRQRFSHYALGSVVTLAVALGIGTTNAFSQSSTTIKVDGSSTVYPISEAMAEEFMKQNSGTQVTVGVSGTGGGFKKFCAGETDISNASRPIKKSEIEACKAKGIEYTEIEIGKDALSVVVSTKNTWLTDITIAELKKLWEPDAEKKIMKWNEVNPKWPDTKIALYGPGTDSGTFDYFTAAIVGVEDFSRADYTATEDDNIIAQGVSKDENALGYFGYAYYVENNKILRTVKVNGVEPSETTVNNGAYHPLARSLYIYVKKSSLSSNPKVKAFVEFNLKNARRIVPDIGYVALPESRYTAALKNL